MASLLFLWVSLVSAPAFGGTLSPAAILQKADRARGGLSQGLQWRITLENSGGQRSEYEVRVKGVNALAVCLSPARQKGETLLFNDRNLWIYKPGLRKPVSLSPRQRLSGQAANGDIATTNYARDYTARLEGEEKIGKEAVYRLFLQAKAKNVTYDKIRYWVSKKDFLGLRADFLTLEGKPLKRAEFTYKNSLPAAGGKVPFVSRMEIRDETGGDATTVITYEQPKPEKIPDSRFNVNNLAQ